MSQENNFSGEFSKSINDSFRNQQKHKEIRISEDQKFRVLKVSSRIELIYPEIAFF